MPQALIRLLALTVASWAGLYALRRLAAAALAAAASVLILSWLADPQDPLALATQVWRAAERPLRALGDILWALARRLMGGVMDALR
jgi:hypothetical protein